MVASQHDIDQGKSVLLVIYENNVVAQSSMVSNRALAVICVESGLHRFLMHDAPHLTKHIKSFVEEIEACKQEAKTDSQRLKYWSTLQAPKVESV